MIKTPFLFATSALSICLMPILTSCTSTGRHVSDWGGITLAPGDTGNCLSNPCSIYFQMPAGTGTYLVTANQIRVGRYPAGQKVGLGGFYESSSIRVPEAKVPPAYVYIPNVH
jgi:hypothetical protein